MEITIETFTVIQWTSLPKDIKAEIAEHWVGFNNHCLLPFNGELQGDITRENLELYYEDQKTNNNFTGTIEEFIKEYGLSLEKYLIDEGIDPESNILIEVYW